VSNTTSTRAADWAGSIRTYVLAWGLPIAAMLTGLFVDAPARTVIWIAALLWMGTACMLNARRCGRTHCRFTGPFYLAMIIPVLVLASAGASSSLYGWLALGAVILCGSKLIWWATERAWGRFS
jgi:hypothetical protein